MNNRYPLRDPIVALALLLTSTSSLPAQTQGQYNFAEALQKAISFYDVQRSGPLPANNRVSWRGDSALADGGDHQVDLTGGWYDAGDNVKFGFPMAGAVTLLAWGVIEYPDAFRDSKQMSPMLDNLRWASDYLMKASRTPNELWGQVGDGNTDHAFWGAAEVLPMARPSFRITADCPGSDLAAETAAALASTSLVFRSQNATDYADTLLARARSLYTFGDTYRGRYSDCIKNAQAFYQSWSGYSDELAWAAAWLFKATGETSYRDKAATAYQSIANEVGTPVKPYKWTHSWDDKSYGTYVLMAELTDDPEYRTSAERWLDYWTSGYQGQRIRYTPGGLAWLDQWGSLRYSANTAFIALIYSDWLQANNLDVTRAARYFTFAEKQIDYILGDNPRHSSYLIGFGSGAPANPHHRTSHGSFGDDINSPANSVHTLYGALVGGPDASDGYADSRTDYVRNEVALDYNAAFVGALARMYRRYGGTPITNFPPVETPSRDELFIEAAVNNRGDNYTEVAAFINNQTAWPARALTGLSFRYFFTLDSDDPADLTVSAAFNECAAPGPPVRWLDKVFYIEVSCAGQVIAPAGRSAYRKQSQFRITSKGAWNPDNDWSITGLVFPSSNLIKTDRIVLYLNGVRVWGTEPPSGPPQPLAVRNAPALPQATAGVVYHLQLDAVGGVQPYTKWEISSGSMPDGLSLNPTAGQITGTPTSAGDTTFEVRVIDFASNVATRQVTLTSLPPLPLTVSTRSMPDAFAGISYSYLLQADGGVPPFTWKIVDGTLAAGLLFDNGAIGGVPQNVGTSTLTVEVSDLKGSTARRDISLQVQPPPSPADANIQLQYRTNLGGTTGNQLGPQFRIVNKGSAAVPLSQLALRYYFTVEGTQPLNAWCDYAAVDCRNVKIRFVDQGGGNFYAEVTFALTAGSISSGATSGDIQTRISKDDWSDFDQSNDYSFNGSQQQFAEWKNVTVYQQGVLLWGVEPPTPH